MICEAEGGWQQAIAAAQHSPFAVGVPVGATRSTKGRQTPSMVGVYRRGVFERIGLFDETLMHNQDDELYLRLLLAGGTIWQSPRIKIWYSPRRSLWARFQQYRQYGYWKDRVIQKHKLPASVRRVVPGGFAFALLMLPVLGL
jgi:GT2 family glycosyltransferase